jgi:hypothetical protein
MAEGWGHVLAAGVNGYFRGVGLAREQKDAEEEQAYRSEVRAAQRAKIAEERSLRQDLTAAAQPVAVVEGSNGAVMPATMDARDIGQPGEPPLDPASGSFRVGAQTYVDRSAAEAAAAQQNNPMNIAARQAAIYNQRGMPTEAAVLENKQAALAKQAAEMKEKGLMTGMARFRAGDRAGTVKALKDSGLFQIADENVTMTPRKMEIPGLGEIQTYDLTFNARNPDGTTEPVTVNSHQASMALMPYEKALELQRKGVKDESAMEVQAQKLNLAQQRLEMQGTLNEARIARIQAGGGGRNGAGGKEDREYRLQLQNMTSQLNREIREADAAIKTLKDDVTVRPNDPRLVELASQRSQLAQRRSALNDEFVSLAEAKRPGNENLAQQRKPKASAGAGGGKPPVIKSKAEYDQLPSGALYVAPNGETMRKK